MPDRINDLYLNCVEQNGLLLDMHLLAEQVCSEGQTRRPYFFAPNIHKSFRMVSTGEQPYDSARRAEIARPAVLGTFKHLDGEGPGISHEALIIKESGSWHVGLPACLDIFFPAAKAVAEDVLSLYGPDYFQDAQICFFSQRHNVLPGDPGKTSGKDLHDHLESDHGTMDLLYVMTDCFPTLFQLSEKETELYPTETLSLSRFGPEIRHVSPRNETGQTLRRTFGTFNIHPKAYLYDGMPNNAGLNLKRAQEFEQAATAYLQSPANTLTLYPDPVALGG
ncbi:MAG: hypothetical protein KDJ75_02995 [Alphaproteobacteria bacterium]|nr:hypothetical protein [Alphaproteobacteria bacterium]